MIRKSTPGRLGFWIKYGSFIALLWLFIHTIYSFKNSDLEKSHHTANIGIEGIQNMLMRKQANDDYDDFNKEENLEDFKDKIEHIEENSKNDENIIELADGITPEMHEIIKSLGLTNPGENGEPVNLPKNMSEDLQRTFDEGYKLHAYNTFASSMIGLNRDLPDVRSDDCKNMKYHDELPKCSIIIIFHNEHWFALIRTVHSILRRSPLHWIEEILLVDDASDMGN